MCIARVINYYCVPIRANPIFSVDYAIEDSIWHILSFENLKKTKGIFLWWPLGGFSFPSNWVCLILGSPIWFCTFVYKNHMFTT